MTCAPLVSSFSLKREEEHRKKAKAVYKALGFATEAQYYRFCVERDYKRYCEEEPEEETPGEELPEEENPFDEPEELSPEEFEEEEPEDEEERRGEELAALVYDHPDSPSLLAVEDLEDEAQALKEWRIDEPQAWAPLFTQLVVLLGYELGEWEAGELIHEYNKRHQLTTDNARRFDYLKGLFISHYLDRVLPQRE